MPTITFSLKDLQNLVGKKLTIEEIKGLASYGKGEFEGYDKDTEEVSISFGDTNLPYLWSVEGIARLFKGLIGKEKGIPELEIFKESKQVDLRVVLDVPDHVLGLDKDFTASDDDLPLDSVSVIIGHFSQSPRSRLSSRVHRRGHP